MYKWIIIDDYHNIIEVEAYSPKEAIEAIGLTKAKIIHIFKEENDYIDAL